MVPGSWQLIWCTASRLHAPDTHLGGVPRQPQLLGLALEVVLIRQAGVERLQMNSQKRMRQLQSRTP